MTVMSGETSDISQFQNGQVVHRLTYHGLTPEEIASPLEQAEHKRIDERNFKEYDWKQFYGDIQEAISPNAPEP